MKCIVSLFILLSFSANGQTIRYTVDYRQQASGIVLVAADFKGFPVNNLSMFVHPAKGIPQGEAEFVKDLKALNADGQPLTVKYQNEGEWTVTGQYTSNFTVSYTIQLKHDQYEWFEAGGVDEVSYATPEGFFSTGYALFLFPAIEDLSKINDVSVSFLLPTGWKASTPWQLQADGSFKAVPDLRFLFNNCFFVGKHKEVLITHEGFQLRIAYSSSYEKSKSLFTRLMRSTISECKRIFNGALKNQYLIVINPHRMTDGSAFRGSFSQIINGPMNNVSAVTWGHTMIHETVHLWNGHSLQPAGQEEWFKEGFTDYLAVLIESRSGLFSPDIIMKRFEKMYSRHYIGKVIQGSPESLRESGNRKQEIRSLVYGGGALFALALDIEMRSVTKGKTGVDQLMKSLFENFAKAGKPYSDADVLQTVNRLTGQDFNKFFNDYLYTKNFVNYCSFFEKIGLHAFPFAEELYLSRSASGNQALRKAMLGW